MSNVHPSKPSLNDADARIVRAREHRADLERVVRAIGADQRDTDWVLLIPASFAGVIVDATHGVQSIPPMVSVLIGETIYNLRAALDYLVYELAILDSGQIQHRTQFPIESGPEGWTKHQTSWLRGINDRHKAAIERLQPYNGVEWTAQLRDLSDPDKHRHLTVASSHMVAAVRIPFSKSQTITARTDGPVRVQAGVSREIFLSDGTHVMQTLEAIERGVGAVIGAFDSDFR